MKTNDLITLLTLKGWQPHGYDKNAALGLFWAGIYNPAHGLVFKERTLDRSHGVQIAREWPPKTDIAAGRLSVEWADVKPYLPEIWQYMVDNLGEIDAD